MMDASDCQVIVHHLGTILWSDAQSLQTTRPEYLRGVATFSPSFYSDMS